MNTCTHLTKVTKTKPETITLKTDESWIFNTNQESLTLRPSPTKVGDACPTASKHAVKASIYQRNKKKRSNVYMKNLPL